MFECVSVSGVVYCENISKMPNRVKWVISFYLKAFFLLLMMARGQEKMINRLEADCEERLKELWIFAWSQKADM